MAFGIVGTPTVIASGGTYTPESGSNRIVVMLAQIKAGTAATLTNLAYTGQTRTPVVTAGDTTENRVGVGICIFKESELGGSTTVTATWSETQICAIECYTFQDADQSTTYADADTAIGVATDGVPVTGVILTGTASGQIVLGCVALRQNVGILQQNSFSADFDATLDPGGNDGRYSSARFTAAGSSVTYSMAPNGLNSSYAMAAVSIIPAAAGGSSLLKKMRRYL